MMDAMKRIVGKIAAFVLVGIFVFPFFVPSIANSVTATFPK